MKVVLIFVTRAISSLAGLLAHCQISAGLSKILIKRFISLYKINCDEILAPLSSFKSVGEFFVRDLKPECRPLAKEELGELCSPVDGVLRTSGEVSSEYAVLVKGKSFNWKDFLICPDLLNEFNGGRFFNFYLSPKDYHNVHFPLAGKVEEVIHHPGGLLPVNDWSIQNFSNLFCFNERVVTVIKGEKFRYLLIMIGALNVGSIELAFLPNFRRSFFSLKTERCIPDSETLARAGDRFGSFKLGSSIVCVFPPEAISAIEKGDCSEVRFGEKIAQLRN